MSADLTLNQAYYFGTFNPVHSGHLQMARQALVQFNLESIIFVPAGEPPFKSTDADLASTTDRLTMLTLAVLGETKFQISTMEFERHGLSYTADSLAQLCEEQGLAQNQHEIPFIIGSDALAGLGQWRQPKDIVAACHFIQAPRSSHALVEAIQIDGENIPLTTTALAMDNVEISSTVIRRAVREKASISEYCPEPVVRYISQHNLYQ